MSEKIILGSGKMYITEANFVGGVVTIPSDAELEVSSNLIGWISGGATLEYTPEFYTAKDDLGKVSKKYLTSEEAILKSGVMTWNGETLEKLVSTARVTESAGKRTVKIGGIDNFDNANYIIRFLHEDETDGDIRITIVGSNESGFEMAFAKDAETVVNAEFKATPHDTEGTLIIFTEEDDSILPRYDMELEVGGSAGTQAVTGAASATSSSTSIATAAVSTGTVSVTPVAEGDCVITVKNAANVAIAYIDVVVTE